MSVELESVFLQLCGGSTAMMDALTFVQLFHDADLIDRNLTPANVEMIFAHAKSSDKQHLDFPHFLSALLMAAECKYGNEASEAVLRLEDAIIDCGRKFTDSFHHEDDLAPHATLRDTSYSRQRNDDLSGETTRSFQQDNDDEVDEDDLLADSLAHMSADQLRALLHKSLRALERSKEKARALRNENRDFAQRLKAQAQLHARAEQENSELRLQLASITATSSNQTSSHGSVTPRAPVTPRSHTPRRAQSPASVRSQRSHSPSTSSKRPSASPRRKSRAWAGVISAEEEDVLRDCFDDFCFFGDRSGKAPLMDGARFAKLARDTGLIGPGLSPVDVDLAFTVVGSTISETCDQASKSGARGRAERKLDFDRFLVALAQLGERKFPTDPVPVARVVDIVLNSHGPVVHGTFAEYDSHLTDPLYYPGAHPHRFNADGTGKGKEGRTDVLYKATLADLTRPGLGPKIPNTYVTW